MKILLTGNGGFVGSNLADRLIAEGHEIFGVDNYVTGREWNVHDDVRMAPGGLRSSEVWFINRISDMDLIVHCAASYKDPDAWTQDVETNVDGALTVARLARKWNARIFYFQTVLPPISSYAISKIAGEHYLRLSGQPLTVFRLASIYGPRNLSGAIPTFYRQIKAGLPCTVVKDATRDFVFIEDLVERVLSAIRNGSMDNARHGHTDVRTGVETRIMDIPQMIGDALGLEPEIKLIPRPAHDVAHYEMDGVPRIGTPFMEGLAKAIEWYEENGVEETFTHLGALSG